MPEFDQAEYANTPQTAFTADLGHTERPRRTLNAMFQSQAILSFWVIAQTDRQKTVPGYPAHVREQYVLGALDPRQLRAVLLEMERLIRLVVGLCSEIEITIMGGPDPLPRGVEFIIDRERVRWVAINSRFAAFSYMSRFVNAIAIRYLEMPDSPVMMPVLITRRGGGPVRYAGPIRRVRGAFKPASRLACHQRYTLSSEGLSCIKALLLVFQRMRALSLPAELVNIVIDMMMVAGGFTLSVQDGNPARWVDPPRLRIDEGVASAIRV